MRSNRVGKDGLTETRNLLATLRDGHKTNSPNLTQHLKSEKVWDRRSREVSNTTSDLHRLHFEVFRDPLVELAKLRKLDHRQRKAYFQGLIKAIVLNLDDKSAIRAVGLLQDEWGKDPSNRSFVDLVQSI